MKAVFAVFPAFSYVTGQVVLESRVRYVLEFHFPSLDLLLRFESVEVDEEVTVSEFQS